MGRGDCRRPRGSQARIDVVALEQSDADRLAPTDRIGAVAPAQDHAVDPGTLDGGFEILTACVVEAVEQIRAPDHLDQVGAQALTIDQRQVQIMQAVDAHQVAAFAHELPDEEIGAELREDVDQLQLDNDWCRRLAAVLVIELEEFRGKQGGEPQIDADRTLRDA